LKRHQLKNFMEKKIKRTSKGRELGSDRDEEKTIVLTIIVALVILSALLVYTVLSTPVKKELFASIYYLDSEKQLENIPKTVVLGENSTFLLWVGVENQYGTTMVFSVEVKMDDGTGSVDPSPVEPVQSFEKSLEDKEVWEFPVTISIEELGSHRIIFELYDPDYTGSYVFLSLEAIPA
jgi:uncharacterized membrane protein